jgi:hypothetical protein
MVQEMTRTSQNHQRLLSRYLLLPPSVVVLLIVLPPTSAIQVLRWCGLMCTFSSSFRRRRPPPQTPFSSFSSTLGLQPVRLCFSGDGLALSVYHKFLVPPIHLPPRAPVWMEWIHLHVERQTDVRAVDHPPLQMITLWWQARRRDSSRRFGVPLLCVYAGDCMGAERLSIGCRMLGWLNHYLGGTLTSPRCHSRIPSAFRMRPFPL